MRLRAVARASFIISSFHNIPSMPHTRLPLTDFLFVFFHNEHNFAIELFARLQKPLNSFFYCRMIKKATVPTNEVSRYFEVNLRVLDQKDN